jgi:flagellum-specific peptidoglycan hydrolase FlgJ
MSEKSSTFAVAKVLNMKKSIFFAALCVTMTLAAQKPNEAYLAYIEQWKETAIQQQIDYGVPAAITMAQALLESGAGKSELAVKANNHFGIKCTSDWFGGVYYHNDETSGECFRQYYDAAESFKDHSLFLKRPRYATCF